MTTIVADFRAGLMVSESKMTFLPSELWIAETKIHLIKGDIVGVAGDIGEKTKWLDWVASGKRGKAPTCAGIEVLILRSTGLFFLLGSSVECRIDRGWHAVGSGGGLALGALAHGASAEEAVKIACEHDANSGGELQILRLPGKEKP